MFLVCLQLDLCLVVDACSVKFLQTHFGLTKELEPGMACLIGVSSPSRPIPLTRMVGSGKFSRTISFHAH